MYASMIQSENIFVQYMARRAMHNVLGTLGINRVILQNKFGVHTQVKHDRRAGTSEGWTITFIYVAMRSARID